MEIHELCSSSGYRWVWNISSCIIIYHPSMITLQCRMSMLVMQRKIPPFIGPALTDIRRYHQCLEIINVDFPHFTTLWLMISHVFQNTQVVRILILGGADATMLNRYFVSTIYIFFVFLWFSFNYIYIYIYCYLHSCGALCWPVMNGLHSMKQWVGGKWMWLRQSMLL